MSRVNRWQLTLQTVRLHLTTVLKTLQPKSDVHQCIQYSSVKKIIKISSRSWTGVVTTPSSHAPFTSHHHSITLNYWPPLRRRFNCSTLWRHVGPCVRDVMYVHVTSYNLIATLAFWLNFDCSIQHITDRLSSISLVKDVTRVVAPTTQPSAKGLQ